MENSEKKNVVVIGGGTGSYSVLSGLREYPNLNLKAVIAVTDDGGSSGKLREEFDIPQMGDTRKCIAALAKRDNGDNTLERLFEYRFQKGGEGLEGHTIGNLIIVALSELFGDFASAIKYSSRLWQVVGNIIPASVEGVGTIAIKQENGNEVLGESAIKDDVADRDVTSPIIDAWLEPDLKANPDAVEALRTADFIIVGPGGIYTSLITNLLVGGIKQAILDSGAPVIFNVNLMTDSGQTYNLSAKGHVDTIAKYLGKYPDYVLVNNGELADEVVKRYIEVNDHPVEDDLDVSHEYKIIRKDLVTGSDMIDKQKDFGTKRSFIRHNSQRLAQALYDIFNSQE